MDYARGVVKPTCRCFKIVLNFELIEGRLPEVILVPILVPIFVVIGPFGVPFFDASVAELVDAADSKSASFTRVWVRVPPLVPSRLSPFDARLWVCLPVCAWPSLGP